MKKAFFAGRLTLVLIIIAGGISACGPRESAVVHVQYTLAGASPEVIDTDVARLIRDAMRGPRGLARCRTISRTGVVDAYITGDPGVSGPDLRQHVDDVLATLTTAFPAGTTPGPRRLLAKTETVPTVVPRMVPSLQVVIDGAKLAAYGLHHDDLYRALEAHLRTAKTSPATGPASGPAAESLLQSTVGTVNGQTVRLRDVATLRDATEPDAVVRELP